MNAIEVVLHSVHKNISEEIVTRIRPGPEGYPLFLKLRLLLYGLLKEIFRTRKLCNHLRKHSTIVEQLGFEGIPNRRTIDRWKQKLEYELQQVINLAGNRYLRLNGSEWTILDSTPIEDEQDPDATVGHNSKGPFIGFKLHMSCDEFEVPLRAVFTQAHVHDSQKGEELLVPTPMGGADAGYDNKKLKQKAREIGMKLLTVHNPRREGKAKKRKTPRMLRKMRVVIEQCNGYVKSQVMAHAWNYVKGFGAKAVFCLTAVFAVQALALYNLEMIGYPSIRMQEVRI